MLCSALGARAQEGEAGAARAAEPGAAVAGEGEHWEPTADARDTIAPAESRAATRTARAGDAMRLGQIERELALVRDEQDATTKLWPILTIAVGVAAMVTGATAGAIEALSCDDPCHSAGWQGAAVIAGTAVTTAGIVWLRWTGADTRELDSRRYRLERERDDIHKASGPIAARPDGTARAFLLGVRGRF